MSNELELVSLKCASCSATIENFKGLNEVKCSYCGNITRVLRPIKVSANTERLEEANISRFNNIVEIMQRSMIAGNYRESYEYCNKALEFDPTNASVWENKAICSYWLTYDSDILKSEAREILTYLHTAKHYNPYSTTYDATSFAISSNLYISTFVKYSMIFPDTSSNGKELDQYSSYQIQKIVDCLKTMDLCFDIHPNPMFLETAVVELTNLGKATWTTLVKKRRIANNWCVNNNFDPIAIRDRYINKIKKEIPSYEAPNFPNVSEDIPSWVFLSGGILILYIFLKAC